MSKAAVVAGIIALGMGPGAAYSNTFIFPHLLEQSDLVGHLFAVNYTLASQPTPLVLGG
jgi:hypothetical protein